MGHGSIREGVLRGKQRVQPLSSPWIALASDVVQESFWQSPA
ncbi:hypothetical protein SynA1560_01454 [Synechococcus sp. A15-60]|nr:hypothetical protein SynA1560_01454 [Synechococcus sp. A15-60]